ncbi:hypothetical protein ORJ04_03560 [Rheinheimera baltica]|uniref:Phasin domain-containing protein n=1 Tax=Rheinheimera baltica TaxID=67576 RepID=A0ABT9HV68_9GAMM|nr:hypothetical protein [Rheinheimera baltica]MDP5135024.1 hypothetical protein [Rheinheimera baltica]
MSVSIANMVETSRAFENTQLQTFQSFIDVSKALKGAIKTEQQHAEKTFGDMQLALDSLQQPAAANGLSPIEVLETDARYMKALTAVTLLPPDVNQPKVAIGYMNTFMQQVAADMAQREQNDE